MSQTHAARAGQEDTRTGAIILMVTSSLAAALVIAALIYAAGSGGRSAAAIAAAGCYPGTGSDTATCTTPAMLASQYTAVITPVDRQLDVDAAAYTATENSDLAAAETALAAEAATERTFGTSLAGIKFPPAIAPLASALIHANQARATITARQARAATLTQMRSYDHQVQAATATVQADMNLIIKAIRTSPAP